MDVKEFVEIDADVTFEMPSNNDIIRAIEDIDNNSQQEEIELQECYSSAKKRGIKVFSSSNEAD
ncbi:4747_t:CDS:2 [Gigaspora rosea]|nr:4747_t:CDS:2 [Gigaspora rosea]